MPTFQVQLAGVDPVAVFDAVADLTQWPSFRGWGPLPGIVRAELVDGDVVATGARIRVTNTDGSVHHEVFEIFEHGRALRIRMELGPPACHVLRGIVETLTWDGVGLTRRFELTPRSAWMFLPACAVTWMMGRAVARHHRTMLTGATGAR